MGKCLGNVYIDKLLVSNKISFGGENYKYFIGYLHNGNKVKLLNIALPETSAYVKGYDGQAKWIHFFTEADNLLKMKLR